MRIVADENIPQAAAALSFLGDVELLPGRTLSRAQLAKCDLLFVRSVTKVNRALLDGTPVQFVATATTGTDHLDTEWLTQARIAFDSAAGSNARSVVEYVIAALLEVALHAKPCSEDSLEGKTLGIIGHGRIGGQIARLAPRLGLRVIACDPPRERAGERDANGEAYLPLLEVMAKSDIVTCHVPLVPDGIDRTTGLLDARALDAMRTGALLINSSRGDVVDEGALLARTQRGDIAPPVLDVWDAEPRIDPDMMATTALSTPHIAGYSFDAKLAGTRMVAESAARFVGATCDWRPQFPHLDNAHITISSSAGAHPIFALRDAVRHAYSIREDDSRLRAGEGDLPTRFDLLRRTYPVRREFAAFNVDATGDAAELCRAFGFRVEPQHH
jgi:erythronate-4-phosphate dehydrogenase